ncbi:MAG: hypothetical protein PVF58_16535 [Candidatus Methanofastidiosia archaeon]|jgi:predicted PurR-regulated permease PerM
MARKIPTRGLLIAIIIVFIAAYLSTRIESTIFRFAILFIAFFFVASAFMGLFYENKIAKQIIQAGYIDEYIKTHGVGTQKTFKQLIAQLKRDGYSMNPGVEKALWEEIKKRTGYHQNSV